jgi:hypothetical protein
MSLSTDEHRYRLFRRMLRPGGLLFFCTLLLPLPAAALSLKVEVEGVEGQQEQNVLVLLAIYQEHKDDDLTVPRMLALHRRAPERRPVAFLHHIAPAAGGGAVADGRGGRP